MAIDHGCKQWQWASSVAGVVGPSVIWEGTQSGATTPQLKEPVKVVQESDSNTS